MLQWGHRLSAVETGSARRPPWYPSQRFNGATAFRQWKPPDRGMWRARCSMLQWGHRLSAVETVTTISRSAQNTMLQWGHRLSAVETGDPSWRGMTSSKCFNGPPPFGSGNCYLCSDSDFNPWDCAASAANTSGDTSPVHLSLTRILWFVAEALREV